MKIRKLFGSFAFAVLVLCAGCGDSTTSAQAADVKVMGDTVVLSGDLNAATISSVRAVITRRTKKLIVTSVGGEIASSIALGKLVVQHGLLVIVRSYCFSGCAHFVFAPARNRYVEAKSLVGFHGTATARQALFKIQGREDLAADYTELARLEQEFYKIAGLSASLLVEPLTRIRPVCFVESSLATPLPMEGQSGIATQVSFFIPTLSSLANFGVKPVKGFWPVSADDLKRSVENLPPTRNLTLILGTGFLGRPEPFQKIPKCVRVNT